MRIDAACTYDSSFFGGLQVGVPPGLPGPKIRRKRGKVGVALRNSPTPLYTVRDTVRAAQLAPASVWLSVDSSRTAQQTGSILSTISATQVRRNPTLKPRYWAFISYSSRDSKWGNWVRKRIENYTIPQDLRGQRFPDGTVLGKHVRPVFRDRDELPGSSNLGLEIKEALTGSRYLVVLCSPNAAQSKWVNKEITDFQAMGRGENVLALILNGEPNSVDASTECFPPALRYPVEPIAGDLRKEGDGKDRGVLKLIAGIARLDFDQIYRRHERALRRRRAVWSLSSVTLILVFAGLAIAAIIQGNHAIRQEQMARAQYLAAQARVELETSGPQEHFGTVGFERAALLALESLEISHNIQAENIQGDLALRSAIARLPGRPSRFLLDDWNAAVASDEFSSLSTAFQPRENRFRMTSSALFENDPSTSQEHAFTLPDGEFSEGLDRPTDIHAGLGLLAYASREGELTILEYRTGQTQRYRPGNEDWYLTEIALSPDGRFVAIATYGPGVKVDGYEPKVEILEIGSWDLKALLVHEWNLQAMRFSGDGNFLTTVTGQVSVDAADNSATIIPGSTIRVWDVARSIQLTRIPLGGEGGVSRVLFSADAEWLLTQNSEEARLWNLLPGRLKEEACERLTRNLSAPEALQFLGTEPPRTCQKLPIPMDDGSYD